MAYTYVDEEDIDSELKCTICYEPFQSPVNCLECGQTFCHQCIEVWKQTQVSCPSCRQVGYTFVPVITRVVLNQLNRLFVQCLLCQQGNIERAHFSDHMAYRCPKAPIVCVNKCGWKGRRETFEEHFVQCQQKQSSWFPFLRRWNTFGSLVLACSLYFML